MALYALMLSLFVLNSAAANETSCEYEEYVPAEGGNVTCTSTAPVLYFLQTHVAEHYDAHMPTSNWTLKCNCPDWSLPSQGIASHVWKQFTDYFFELSEGHFECGYKQFLSGLVFDLQEIEPGRYRYTWWGRCTNFSEAFTSHEDFCWNGGDYRLSDSENGTLEIDSSRLVIRRVTVVDKRYLRDSRRFRSAWRYEVCLVLPVECTMPAIKHGYTESTPGEFDVVGGDIPTKRYNESINVYCNEGFYMDGPNVTFCQGDGQWTQLPTCKACKSIRYCKVLECSDGRRSTCMECRQYTSEGLLIRLSHNRKKCRVVPYINRTQINFLLLFEVGDTLLLNCPSRGVPAPTVEWSSYTKGNMSVYEFINSTRLQAFTNGSLEISDLTQGDEGVYACTATNSVGRDTVYIVLINLELYRFYRTPDSPRILNQTVIPHFFEADQPTLLHCLATGTPPPRIRWSRNWPGHVRTPVPPERNLRIHQYENGTLGFFPIRFEDWGVYTCEAVNDYGVAAAQWIVCVDHSCGEQPSGGVVIPPVDDLIPYPPFILELTQVYVVNEGGSLTLTCVAGGNPAPQLRWTHHNSLPIEGGGTITVANATLNDTSVYRCSARNYLGVAFKQTAVIVQPAPDLDHMTSPLTTAASTVVNVHYTHSRAGPSDQLLLNLKLLIGGVVAVATLCLE